MTSLATESFWRLYRALPVAIQSAAKRSFGRFQADPHHPSLRLKKLRSHDNLWSARVTLSYRAVAVRHRDTWTWIWIGSHADFDEQFS